MSVRQLFVPNIGKTAVRGYCLGFVDDAGAVSRTAPPRTRNARTALNNEIAAKRLRSGNSPLNIWVVGFLDLRAGQFAADDHVFLMKYLGNGKYDIRDSESNGGGRKAYGSIAEILAWFGRYSPIYVGYSYVCDGRVYAEDYSPAPPAQVFKRIARKGTAKVTIDGINVRTSPNPKSGKVVGTYTKGKTVNYDSYVVTNGFVWLSWIGEHNERHYMAEGPYDGNPKNVWVSGGV